MSLSVTSFTPAFATHSASWTFMVYMAADNNLDPAALDDINEMETVGSTADVNILVLLDRWDEEALTGSWIYYIEHDEDPENVTSPIVEDLGEVNTGDPETLTYFVNYCIEEYPADNYGLVLWDHGHGWFGVCWDWTSEDKLTPDEIQTALLKTPGVNLIGFDACLMSMLEIGYELRQSANVMVASEAYEPWDGWPYDMVLKDLVNNPDWTAEELGMKIVDDYIESYNISSLVRPIVTMAVINLSEIPGLTGMVDELSVFLLNNLDEYYGAITGAKNHADRYPTITWGPPASFVDFYHAIDLLGTNKDLKPYADKILGTWENVVIATKTYGQLHREATGLTIYFPRNAQHQYYPEEYKVGLDFATDTHWDELLVAYFEAMAFQGKPQ